MKQILLFILAFILLVEACKRARPTSTAGKTGNNAKKKKVHFQANHRSAATCKNHKGESVDWWFILEESGGQKRYLYFDSVMAKICDGTGEPPRFLPLSDDYTLDDPETSPLLLTLYSSRPFEKSTAEGDNTITIAINDQRGTEGNGVTKMQNLLKKIARESRDPNASFIKLDQGHDIFGHPITSKNAHAKYIYTVQVAPVEENENVLVRSYLISHSLPRFPNFNTRADGTMVLPKNPADVFGKNIVPVWLNLPNDSLKSQSTQLNLPVLSLYK